MYTLVAATLFRGGSRHKVMRPAIYFDVVFPRFATVFSSPSLDPAKLESSQTQSGSSTSFLLLWALSYESQSSPW
jgi:hypothetical protein